MLGILVLLCCLAGCRASPKFRMGALPYPGVPLFHVIADPHELGEHRYKSYVPFLDSEKDRGIVYTSRAGFVDIAHIRDTADWTRLCTREVRKAIGQRRERLTFEASDSTHVTIRFSYPTGWEALPEARREALADRLALRIGQRTAYALATWHEVITWFGWTTVPLVSERYSAFTYDDIVAHMVGIEVAEQALLDEEHPYNAAVTRALESRLVELGAVSPDDTRRAVGAVQGWWWESGHAIKRHLDSAFAEGVIRPMIVPGFAEYFLDGSAEPVELRLPKLGDIDAGELDLAGFYHSEFDPRIQAWRDIREHLPGRPRRLDPESHLPVLIDVIRLQMREEIDPNVDTLDDRPGSGATAMRAERIPQAPAA